MAKQIFNGGIEGGILRIVHDSDPNALSEKDKERLKYLESLPKNTWITLDGNGMAVSEQEAQEMQKREMRNFKVIHK